MSFLKITDPRKRDFLVNQLLETRKKIRDDSLSEQFGDMTRQRELDKIFKPVTSQLAAQQLATQAEIQKQTAAIEGLPNRLAITGAPLSGELLSLAPLVNSLASPLETPPLGSIPAPTVELGEMAKQYLSDAIKPGDHTDKKYGIRKEDDNNWYIGNKIIHFNGDNIRIGDNEYKGTPGLWELITSKVPDQNIYNDNDYAEFAKIMYQTSAMKRDYNPGESHPAHSKASKWTKILKPLWDNDPVKITTKQSSSDKTVHTAHEQERQAHGTSQAHKSSEAQATTLRSTIEDDDEFEDVEDYIVGSSVANAPLVLASSLAGAEVETIFLPSDQVALENRLDYLLASKRAGNTGVINEITAILDELLRRKIIDEKQYKLLTLI